MHSHGFFSINKNISLQALLRHAVGGACYPDRACTPLVTLSQEVVHTLLQAGCNNQAAVVAAALGDLPYSRNMWRNQVICTLCSCLAMVLYSRLVPGLCAALNE